MEKLGLVLCGGGARGAFEVGVWEELDDLGITKEITGFSGTSIGAVNTALFLSNSTNQQKEDIWKTFEQKDMISIKEALQRFAAIYLLPISSLISIPDMLINGFFDQSKLKSLLEALVLNFQKIYKYDVFITVTDLCVAHMYTAFIDWKTVPENEIKTYVRYSAKIPIFNGAHVSKKQLGHLIVDGGFRDFHRLLKKNSSNTPIAPLYAKGYRKFIVVYLSTKKESKEQIERENKWFRGAEICRIFYNMPKEPFSTIAIDEKKTVDRISAGRAAVKKMLIESDNNGLIFEKTKPGNNTETISRTLKCIQRGEKVVNGKVQYYI